MSLKGCPHEVELSAYLDNELASNAAAEIETHLVLCSNCGAAYRSLSAVDELLSSNSLTLAVPSRMKYKLEKRISEFRDSKAPSRWQFWRSGGYGVAHPGRRVWVPAAALLVLLGFFIAVDRYQSHQESRRLLMEIERYKADIITQTALQNPFRINGEGAEVNAGNPFEEYLPKHR